MLREYQRSVDVSFLFTIPVWYSGFLHSAEFHRLTGVCEINNPKKFFLYDMMVGNNHFRGIIGQWWPLRRLL